MIKRLSAVALSALALAALSAAPASAAGQVCYDVQVNVQGQSVISQAGCQDLP